MDEFRKPVLKKMNPKEDHIRKSKEFIEEGKYAVLLLSGGQGTRLGVKGPKGAYKVPLSDGAKSCFEIHIKKIKEHKRVMLLIMCSNENLEATKEFFERNNFFDIKERIIFFTQSDLPLLELDGKTPLKVKGKKVMASSGHGDVIPSLNKIMEDIEGYGIKKIFISNIDNINSKLIDYEFIYQSMKSELVIKVVEKCKSTEKVGVFAKNKKNELVVLEYSEIPDNLKNMRDEGGLYFRAANIMCQILDIDTIKNIAKKRVKLHSAYKSKKIEGEEVEFIKKETFLFDYFKYVKNYKLFMVYREQEFAPIKDISSIETAVSLYEAEQRRIAGKI